MRDPLLILHFIGLSMGLGVGFTHMFIGIASKKWTQDETLAIYTKLIKPLDIMGHAGFGLLIISGLGLLHPYFKTFGSMPMLHAKFTLVFILLALVIYMTKLGKKMVATQDKEILSKLEKWGGITHFVGIGVVICAVLTFH